VVLSTTSASALAYASIAYAIALYYSGDIYFAIPPKASFKPKYLSVTPEAYVFKTSKDALNSYNLAAFCELIVKLLNI
jgi:hypothetical protein